MSVRHDGYDSDRSIGWFSDKSLESSEETPKRKKRGRVEITKSETKADRIKTDRKLSKIDEATKKALVFEGLKSPPGSPLKKTTSERKVSYAGQKASNRLTRSSVSLNLPKFPTKENVVPMIKKETQKAKTSKAGTPVKKVRSKLNSLVRQIHAKKAAASLKSKEN
jgi:hypothetical protein